jgi:SpoVK/Ycf46/Vps4 family AAA+-type ATPase
MEALAKDETFVRKSYAGCTGVSFFQKFYELTHLRHENKMSTKLMKQEFQRLCDDNPNLPFVLALQDLELAPMDKVVITHMCRHLVLHSTVNLIIDNMTFLYDNKTDKEEFERSLESDYNTLLLEELVEFAFVDGFCSKNELCLTDKSRKCLLKDFDIKSKRNPSSEFVFSKDIAQKQLYFGQEVQQQLDSLYSLLNEEHYQSVCARLKEKGLRQGFTCLFYGEPGTGKTESVLQLAQRTGRDLMQLNFSEIKSMWVGESEKNIKAVFDRYRAITQQSKQAPILLFNEADAIIGKRKEGAERSVDKMENTIQNIILQEMESLEGIMIATTNLVQNMDTAFERRFLYKVRFEKPQLDQRIQIWHSMMPDLSEDVVSRLASVYDFSGGQIENIVRKCDVESILYGQQFINDEKIEQYCKEEKIIMKGNHQIGFRI